MSIVLKRGDHVHLAVPLTRNNPADANEEAARMHRELTDFYRTYGITVALTSATNSVPHVTVVAVLSRDE